MQWCAVAVQGAEFAQVAEAGTVAGGQDDRIDPLELAVATILNSARYSTRSRPASQPYTIAGS